MWAEAAPLNQYFPVKLIKEHNQQRSGRVRTVHDNHSSFVSVLNARSCSALLEKNLFLEFKEFMIHAGLSSLRKSFCSMETEVISHRGKISRKEAYFGGLVSHWDLLTAGE